MRQGEESWMGITEQLLRNELLDSGTDPEWGCHVTMISGAAGSIYVVAKANLGKRSLLEIVGGTNILLY